jgi:arginyl-tRNA synthetase
VQYAHARIAAILRNAGGPSGVASAQHALKDEEKELIKRLTDFPVTVREAAERRGPQLVPAYAIRLADDFHRFYHECRVLGDPAEEFRLALCRATQQVIARCLDLVGVEAPERM